MLYQLSYEATHWEQGQFIEFISSRTVKSCEIYMTQFIFVLRWTFMNIRTCNSQQHPTCCNTSQYGGQTHATCCAQQCCDMLRCHIAIVWPRLYMHVYRGHVAGTKSQLTQIIKRSSGNTYRGLVAAVNFCFVHMKRAFAGVCIGDARHRHHQIEYIHSQLQPLHVPGTWSRSQINQSIRPFLAKG